MPEMKWLILLFAVAGLLQSAPASATADDDWALIANCRDLNAFVNKHRQRSRYASYYADQRKRLKCPAPRARNAPEQPSHSANRPIHRSQPAPTYLTLDANGGGDTASLADALRLISNSGTIVVRPGTYSADVEIRRPVRLVGRSQSDGVRPVILSRNDTSPVIRVVSKGVTITGVELRGVNHRPALRVSGASELTLVDTVVRNDSAGVATENKGYDSAISIIGEPTVTIRSSVIRGNAGALNVSGGVVSIIASDLISSGANYATLNGDGGQITIDNALIQSPSSKVAVWARGTLNVSINRTVFRRSDGTDANQLALQSTDSGLIDVNAAVFCGIYSKLTVNNDKLSILSALLDVVCNN